MLNQATADLLQVREALEASWDEQTAYSAVKEAGNPARGQCYPTARVVQFFFPETEIAKGQVWNGQQIEVHFWNVLMIAELVYHIDLTWQQFPLGSSVRSYELLDRTMLGDGPHTIQRCTLLQQRVLSRETSSIKGVIAFC